MKNFLYGFSACFVSLYAGLIMSAKLDQKTMEIGWQQLKEAKDNFEASLRASNQACEVHNAALQERVDELKKQVRALRGTCLNKWEVDK
jgi:polyhydroxyalkanoate synthesis regulator phasin